MNIIAVRMMLMWQINTHTIPPPLPQNNTNGQSQQKVSSLNGVRQKLNQKIHQISQKYFQWTQSIIRTQKITIWQSLLLLGQKKSVPLQTGNSVDPADYTDQNPYLSDYPMTSLLRKQEVARTGHANPGCLAQSIDFEFVVQTAKDDVYIKIICKHQCL